MWVPLLIILFGSSFFYLFVCVDPHSGTLLSRMRNFLFIALPNILRAIGRRTCGHRFVDTVDYIANYLCY